MITVFDIRRFGTVHISLQWCTPTGEDGAVRCEQKVRVNDGIFSQSEIGFAISFLGNRATYFAGNRLLNI